MRKQQRRSVVGQANIPANEVAKEKAKEKSDKLSALQKCLKENITRTDLNTVLNFTTSIYSYTATKGTDAATSQFARYFLHFGIEGVIPKELIDGFPCNLNQSADF